MLEPASDTRILSHAIGLSEYIKQTATEDAKGRSARREDRFNGQRLHQFHAINSFVCDTCHLY